MNDSEEDAHQVVIQLQPEHVRQEKDDFVLGVFHSGRRYGDVAVVTADLHDFAYIRIIAVSTVE